MSEVKLLVEEILKGAEALRRIEAFYDRVTGAVQDGDRSPEKAIVIADLLTKHYTCVETLFLRVSQCFENHLSDDRWHTDLLFKMTLRIEGVRESVIRDSTHDVLVEMLKFRHFTRYYYDILYDWDRLDYLMKKFAVARVALSEDLKKFLCFLDELGAGE